MYFLMCLDVDDKIIKRGRQEFLFKEYCSTAKDLQSISRDLSEGLDDYVKGILSETDPDKKTMKEKSLAKIQDVMKSVAQNIKNNPNDKNSAAVQKEILLQGSKDVLYDWLDNKLSKENRVFPNEVFGEFSKKWEDEYFNDMTALNVLPPAVLTRVSEYVPEIVDYIKKIIENGYAYESKGSVYFNVGHFKQSPNHKYAKLVPEAVGNEKMLMEGEGENINIKNFNIKLSNKL
jgi:cysteinyl-tRNA synthetase